MLLVGEKCDALHATGSTKRDHATKGKPSRKVTKKVNIPKRKKYTTSSKPQMQTRTLSMS
jgi:hypothetical protein